MSIPVGNRQENVERFDGFAALYDQHRPEAPKAILEILGSYLGRKAQLVMDIGCGTGLSTMIWDGHAERVIGVEPNDGMRAQAEAKLGSSSTDCITFVKGFSNQLDAVEKSVDVITCSQSFHWMEPISTLQEAGRVLKPGGIFAAYDCDWPPVIGWQLEQEYMRLIAAGDELLEQLEAPDSGAVKRNKEQHLATLRESGVFRYTREIVFHHQEDCTSERFIGLALSQGGLQSVLKLHPEAIVPAIEAFRASVEKDFGGVHRTMSFGYRMRIGIK